MSIVSENKICGWFRARVCLLQCKMLCTLWRESDSSLKQSDLGVYSVSKKARVNHKDWSMDDSAVVHRQWYARSKRKPGDGRWGRRRSISSTASATYLQSPTSGKRSSYPSIAKTIQPRESTTTTNGSASTVVTTQVVLL